MSIEAIKEALEAGPTDGPWTVELGGSPSVAIANDVMLLAKTLGDNDDANAAFIAACNPVAIRELIERLEEAELKIKELRGDHVPTPDDISAQDWSGMDGAIAYHLIDRHGENWSHIGRLMHAWRDAAIDSAMAGGLAEGVSDA